MNTKMLK